MSNWHPTSYGNHLAVHWALDQSDYLYRNGGTTHDLLILVTIANHANHQTARCWLSNRTVAREALCNVRSVQRSVTNLVGLNLLSILGQNSTGVNIYELAMDSESAG
jgi:hypothetical protein